MTTKEHGEARLCRAGPTIEGMQLTMKRDRTVLVTNAKVRAVSVLSSPAQQAKQTAHLCLGLAEGQDSTGIRDVSKGEVRSDYQSNVVGNHPVQVQTRPVEILECRARVRSESHACQQLLQSLKRTGLMLAISKSKQTTTYSSVAVE